MSKMSSYKRKLDEDAIRNGEKRSAGKQPEWLRQNDLRVERNRRRAEMRAQGSPTFVERENHADEQS